MVAVIECNSRSRWPVVMMPPTLVASIYGMNFEFMPELKTVYGYPVALIMMVISAILPYMYFKWKKWL